MNNQSIVYTNSAATEVTEVFKPVSVVPNPTFVDQTNSNPLLRPQLTVRLRRSTPNQKQLAAVKVVEPIVRTIDGVEQADGVIFATCELDIPANATSDERKDAIHRLASALLLADVENAVVGNSELL
jgi:hypothetical protein